MQEQEQKKPEAKGMLIFPLTICKPVFTYPNSLPSSLFQRTMDPPQSKTYPFALFGFHLPLLSQGFS